MNKSILYPCLVILLCTISISAYSQDEGAVEERTITKTISIDSLKKVQYLEDLLDSFPKKDYFIYWCYVTRSGKGYVTTTTVIDNDNTRYDPRPGHERRPIMSSLFENRERPVKPGQKYFFDRIHIRKFKDKNSSEPWPNLELFITD